MIGDPAVLRELCRSFVERLGDLDHAIQRGHVADAEAQIEAHVVALARGLGWRTGLRYRLAPMDFPRAGTFPKRNHEHTASMRLRGPREAELWMNSNALDVHFTILLARLPVLLWLFGAALERDPQLHADVACFPGDVCRWNAVNFSGTDPRGCLVPDPTFFDTTGFSRFRETVRETLPAWERRRRTVIWRGSTSGIKRYWPPAAPDDVRWLPRLELCARASSGPLAAACDVGYTQLVQIPQEDLPAMEHALASLRRPWVEHTQYAGCIATIDIDGNSNTWARGLFCSLLTGACVIKVDSEHGFRQWYYDRLVPWVHYVPVRSDLSDLDEKVELVLGDDRLARSIGGAGRELALSVDFASEMSAAVERMLAWIARPAADRTP